MLSLISNFPIGDYPRDRKEYLCKASIISYLARFQEQLATIEEIDERENKVRKLLGEVLAVSANEHFPSLSEAERTLKLATGFVQDFGKVQMIKEINPLFSQTYNALAKSLSLDSKSKTM